jgi:ribulose-5-phosphate 4-epimerase/fuculose-1-phosphate aldolase
MDTQLIDNPASLRGQVTDSEWETRVELAAAFRIANMIGWNDGPTNHITARLPGTADLFLINPQGVGWDEVTASSLITADLSGTVVSKTDFAPGPAGLNFHSAVLAARPEIACTMHIHPKAGVVVSALKQGLMILDQRGCLLHDEVAYHAFEGYARAKDESPRIVAELGAKHCMIMKNHGLLVVGRTIGECFYFMGKLIGACELQERVMATGAEIETIPEDVIALAKRQTVDRRKGKPLGGMDWKLLYRRLERTDTSFMR